ncbi:hypothetical protein BaOVIS_014110 [Babesia ovis]|uniref:ThiF family protein n=1 Tax=Babesia ovis TaxID=5869 RepID=A0A9W5T9T5_BABOV|nr:hypothetical protein BaOVIS_014110 [Babesia ovis]
MEAETSSKLPPIYVNKSKRVRTDVLTRQALVPPIFRRREILKREAKYARVHSANVTNEAQTAADEQYRNSLYEAYKTDFNFISPELKLNRNLTKSQETKDATSGGDSDGTARKTPRRRKRQKTSLADFPDTLPSSPWLHRVTPMLFKIMAEQDEALNDPSSSTFQTKISQIHKSDERLEESTLREVANVLTKMVTYIDDWRENARKVIHQGITIEEARTLLEEFREITGGLIKVDFVTEMENDIKSCEEFGAKVMQVMTTPSSGSDRTVSLEDVHNLVQESRTYRFLVPEVVALQSILRNLLSIRSLMERSVLELDINECESLAAISEKGIVHLPRLDELRRRLQESVWLHSANRVCQRQVKYSFAKNLLESVPDVLRDHRLYSIVKQKCQRVENWLGHIAQFSFYKMIVTDGQNGGQLSKKTALAQSTTDKEADPGIKCDARTFDELCSTYYKLGMTLPVYRNIEPLYQSLRRLHRRLTKIESLLDTNSRNPNLATDCLLLLQHSESLSVYIDLTEQLQPIRTGVELWLDYEKRCRKVLDSVKSYSITADFNKLKTDWGFLLTFRKTTKLTDSDFDCLRELMQAYVNEERVSFDEIRKLEAEFSSLRVKNLVLQREMNEIFDKGHNLLSKINTSLEDIKEDLGKSDAVLSHVVMVILDVLKFGAKLDSMPVLILCLDYLRWSRDFYNALLSDINTVDGGSRLKALAAVGTDVPLKEITSSVDVNKTILEQLYEAKTIPPEIVAPIKEFDLLRHILVNDRYTDVRIIIGDYCILRKEFRVHAFAAVDGSLWLDEHSFDEECCRFKDCESSSSSITTRHAAERAQLLTRCTPTAQNSLNCKCSLVPGTLVSLPNLSDFRGINLQLEVERACGKTSLNDGLQIFGTPINRDIWQYNGRFSGIANLRRFVIVSYMDIKACICHYSIASPVVKPVKHCSLLHSSFLYASGDLRDTEPKHRSTFNLYISEIVVVAQLFPSPVPYIFFAASRINGKLVTVDICDIHVIDDGNLSLKGTNCSVKDIIFVGFGKISNIAALPRHWCTAILALCHTLSLYSKRLRFMLIDMDATTAIRENRDRTIAVVYEISFGDTINSVDDLTINYGYRINTDCIIPSESKHEHIYDFRQSVDPNSVDKADSSLRLQMMTWRIVPELKPGNITKLRICVIGVGSLGCQIIRQLLAWGVYNFVIIDYGIVTNSTRQCLYTSQHTNGNIPKIVAASSEIGRIRPDADVYSLNMFVPMPGHQVSKENLEDSYQKLSNLMLSSDVVFLSTDSKESRWLPSLIGAAACTGSPLQEANPEDDSFYQGKCNKTKIPLVISTGVSFDSYMIVRHGYGNFQGGCYFCSDVQPPNDTISGRPLDETCTLVKPGAVGMCAAAAVELLISLTQHDDGFQALHNSSSCLGRVPHAIHMNLSDLSIKQLYVGKSEHCVCCSKNVIERFKSDPRSFLSQVMENPSILSDISGLNTSLKSVSTYNANDAPADSDYLVL